MANCNTCYVANEIIEKQTKLLNQANDVASQAVDKASELNVRLQDELMRVARLTAIAVTATRMLDDIDPEMATELLKAIDYTTKRD